MQRPKCSSRGRTMKKNGRTSGGKIRYRCAGCGASTSANPDNEGQGPVHRAGPAHVQGRTRDASSAGAYAATQVRADVEPDTARTQRRRRACRAAPRRHPSGSRRGRAHRRRRDLARGGVFCQVGLYGVVTFSGRCRRLFWTVSSVWGSFGFVGLVIS